MFSALILFVVLLKGGGLGPLLQCHVSDQDWICQAAVFSKPCHGGVSSAADTGLWGPGSYGHGGLAHLPGGSCRPRRGHASWAGHSHGPHHGKSPWMVRPAEPLTDLLSYHFSSLSLRRTALALNMWWLISRVHQDKENLMDSCFCLLISDLNEPLALWQQLCFSGACIPFTTFQEMNTAESQRED